MGLYALLVVSTCSFSLKSTPSSVLSKKVFVRGTQLSMAPKYNKLENRWEPTTEADMPEAGYGLVGSLIRAGPLPFIQRIIKPDEYEQGVLKYMASEKCDRMEAQGNFDAYLENPNDWAYQKLQEKQGKPKKDYATANTDPKQLVLTTAWAAVVISFSVFLIYGSFTGKWTNADIGEITSSDWIGLE